MAGLVAMDYLKREGGRYRQTAKRLPKCREWHNDIGPVQIPLAEANGLLDEHYLGSAGFQRAYYCLATPARDVVAVYGAPVASHFNIALDRPLELTRLWRAPDCPFPLSQFLAASLRWLRRHVPEADCVFSYADPAVRNPVSGIAHSGGIYVAANFAYLGKSHRTAHWITPAGQKISSPQCYRLFKTKSVVKIAKLQPTWQLIRGEPKLLYVYPLRMTVPEVLAAIGGDGHLYSTVKEKPAVLEHGGQVCSA